MAQAKPKPTTPIDRQEPIPTALNDAVKRHCEPSRLTGDGTISELAETIRDRFNLATRVRFSPSGDWYRKVNGAHRQEWHGYGYEVVLTTPDSASKWGVTIIHNVIQASFLVPDHVGLDDVEALIHDADGNRSEVDRENISIGGPIPTASQKKVVIGYPIDESEDGIEEIELRSTMDSGTHSERVEVDESDSPSPVTIVEDEPREAAFEAAETAMRTIAGC